MSRRLKGLAALAALLMLTGCGSTGAQTATSKQAEPKDEAAEFGADLASMLNDGKSKELFGLWLSGDGSLKSLSKALLPDAKTKGMEWKYKEGSFESKKGIVTLEWKTSDNQDTRKFEVAKVKGKWRLVSSPFAWVDACVPFSVDGTDAPIIKKLPHEEGPCYTDAGVEGGISKAGQILLLVPGEHSFSFDPLKNVVKQPYKAISYPDSDQKIDFTREPGVQSKITNLVPKKAVPAAGYAEAFKAAFLEAQDITIGNKDEQHPDLFDGVTVAPTNDILKPVIGGTYQHWTKDGYQPRDASKLDWVMSLTQKGITIGVRDTEATGM